MTEKITEKMVEFLPILNHEVGDKKMNNEAAVTAAKDTDVFLLLSYALEQVECFLPQ